MILRIDYNVVSHTYGKLLFDLDTFQFYEQNSEDAEFLTNYLPFPTVSDYECKKAFLNKLNSIKKIPHKVIELLDKDFEFWFWQIVDDGDKILNEFDKFEKQYSVNEIIKWCGENNIPHYIDKSDDLLMYYLR